MPNHITNLLTVTGPAEDVDAFRAAHVSAGDRGPVFDFRTVVPVPACVDATSRPFVPSEAIGDFAVEIYARALLETRSLYVTEPLPSWIPGTVRKWGELIEWLKAKHPTIDKWGRARLACAAETGYPGWYDWNCANWGTKWGAYQYKEREHAPGRFVFEFQTAWSSPQPIFSALAERWPTLTIAVEAIDEGGGEYEGSYHGAEHRFVRADDNDDRYLRVYGEPRPTHEDE